MAKKAKKGVTFTTEPSANVTTPTTTTTPPRPRKSLPPGQAKLQGVGSDDDLALLLAVCDTTGESAGMVIARGVRLVYQAFTAAQKAKADKIREAQLTVRKLRVTKRSRSTQ